MCAPDWPGCSLRQRVRLPSPSQGRARPGWKPLSQTLSSRESARWLSSPAISGIGSVVFTPRALDRRVKCRSFYFDLQLLEDYWVKRKYHHTMSSTLVYALAEALAIVEEEGLEVRWARHERHHQAFIAGLATIG